MGFFSASKTAVNTDEKKVGELLARGVENVLPHELAIKKLHSGERLRIYFGIDPTGAKLHLGHSVPLRKLKAFSDLGHQVIFVVGSFTAMIGDPSGRDAMRAPLTKEQVEENFQTYKKQAQKILDFSKVEIRYNGDWLAPLTFSDIIKLASNYTVQQMIQRDMFEKRLKEGKPIALHEFLYPVMVGYDSVVLDVDCELGGSDQEFNMLSGRHLQERMGKREKFVLTTRLIEGTDGRKMSKSYDNCIYLEDTPQEMFGKLMSIKDELIKTYFDTLTDVPLQEIETMTTDRPRDAKLTLAKEIVRMYHGKDAAVKAADEWVNTFSKGGVPSDLPVTPAGKLRDLVKDISTSELRRLVEQGAITSAISGKKIESIDANVTNDTLRIGKHRFLKVE